MLSWMESEYFFVYYEKFISEQLKSKVAIKMEIELTFANEEL